jgi:hypothetical protein
MGIIKKQSQNLWRTRSVRHRFWGFIFTDTYSLLQFINTIYIALKQEELRLA